MQLNHVVLGFQLNLQLILQQNKCFLSQITPNKVITSIAKLNIQVHPLIKFREIVQIFKI